MAYLIRAGRHQRPMLAMFTRYHLGSKHRDGIVYDAIRPNVSLFWTRSLLLRGWYKYT